MRAGTSQVDITPEPGVELSGFAARTQPSVGVLDSLFANALHLAANDGELLWIHCDLIGLDQALVGAFREWARQHWGLPENRIILSASHTHSGPGTLRLHECGRYDASYGEFLLERLQSAAEAARSRLEPCEVVNAEGRIDLAVDRRQRASAHTDPRVGGIGFRRDDGSYAAVVVNYAIHPVALGPLNRHLSGDIMGQAARALAALLPGSPTVLATCGACGNLNPPAVNVAAAHVAKWGWDIARAIAGPLTAAGPGVAPQLQVRSRRVSLPLDVLDAQQIDALGRSVLEEKRNLTAWGGKLPRVIEKWSRDQLELLRTDRAAPTRDVELIAVELGESVVVGINAEVFSRCSDALRAATGRDVLVVGCANGVLGYLPTMEAYAEGGYEVDVAHFFYGSFRFRAGALELLTQEAAELVRAMSRETRGDTASAGGRAIGDAGPGEDGSGR